MLYPRKPVVPHRHHGKIHKSAEGMERLVNIHKSASSSFRISKTSFLISLNLLFVSVAVFLGLGRSTFISFFILAGRLPITNVLSPTKIASSISWVTNITVVLVLY